MWTRAQAQAHDRAAIAQGAQTLVEMEKVLDNAAKPKKIELQHKDVYHIDDVVFLAKLFVQTKGGAWRNKRNWEVCVEGSKTSGSFSEARMMEQRWEDCYGITFKSRNHDSNTPYETCMRRLHRIEMLDNNLCGAVPCITACTSLVHVNIGHNHITGQIPDDIGRLSSLRYFSIYGNSFNGAIPDSLGQCLHLETLYLNANRLDGVLPESFSNLQQLNLLNVSSNNIDCSIPFPPHILQCATLQTVNFTAPMICRVGRNQCGAIIASGKTLAQHAMRCIPDEVRKLAQLTQLHCANLRLVGKIPAGLFELTHLKDLKLSHNELVGDLPAGIGLLVHLHTLELDANRLSG
jgi:hypothetical protein